MDAEHSASIKTSVASPMLALRQTKHQQDKQHQCLSVHEYKNHGIKNLNKT